MIGQEGRLVKSQSLVPIPQSLYNSAMREFRVRKILPFAFIVLAVLGIAVFLLRSPVLIVTDSSFDQLYGAKRLRLKAIRNSLELFRRVVSVSVDESAGPGLVALAAEGAARSPEAVLFPYRYLQGAQVYREGHPNVAVLVFGGPAGAPKTPDSAPALSFVYTDTAGDLYRAGLCAAFFVQGNDGVLVFTGGNLSNQYREAFRRGLRDQGFLGNPVFLDDSADYPSYSGIGCVVVAGPAAKFLEQNLKIPVILFSWTDPAITPRSVKLVFDDSLPALAFGAFRAFSADLKRPGEIPVSSQPALLYDRIEKKSFRKLARLTKEKFEEK